LVIVAVDPVVFVRILIDPAQVPGALIVFVIVVVLLLSNRYVPDGASDNVPIVFSPLMFPPAANDKLLKIAVTLHVLLL
jgi:hypothetical protein